MQLIKWLSAAGCLAMTVVLVYAFLTGEFARDGAALLENPWGIVSMVDLYTGFTLFSGWIVFRERSSVRALVWVFFMMTLGFLTASIYVFMVASSSGGDWEKFWMGKRVGG